jgi:hypothetical protein
MKTWHYVSSGLRVRSDLPLPEWRSLEVEPTPETDVLIALGTSADGHGEKPSTGVGSVQSFQIPGVGSVSVSDGRQIIVVPQGKSDSELRSVLLGSAWATVCHQRGRLVVHASAVRVGEFAVAFCGPAQTGKSTLAAYLDSRGYEVLSEDLCCFELSPGLRPLIHRGTSGLRLWDDALTSLEWAAREKEPDPFRPSKFRIPLITPTGFSPVPVRAICLLSWGQLDIRQVTGLEALRQFLNNAPYRATLAPSLESSGQYAARCIDFLRETNTWNLTRPRDLSVLPRTFDLLQEHWCGLRYNIL